MAFYAPSSGGSTITIGTTPISGGADTQVLFNDGGFVGSDGNLTYDSATSTLTIGSPGVLTLGAMTAGSVLFAGTGGVVSQDNARFFWDDTNTRLGILTASPQVPLHVVGNSSSHRGFGNAVEVWEGASLTLIAETTTTGTGWAQTMINGAWDLRTNPFGTFLTRIGVTSTGQWTVTAGANITPTTPEWTHTGGAHTAVTASTELIDINYNLARTVQHATGALTTQRAFVIQAPTYSFVGASTITTAATLAITAAPTAGTNATITNAYALWVQAGKSVFVGGATTTDSTTSEAFGRSASANNDNSVAFGPSAVAGTHSVAVGVSATATTGGIALGQSANASSVNHFVAGSTATDAFISNVFIGNGITAAAPQSVVYNATGGSGTNIAGASLSLAGGKGTGNAAGGAIPFLTSDAGGSGTTLQTLTEKARITVGGNLCIGVTTAGTSAAKVLCLSNSATAPSDSADRVQLWAEDLSAGNATLAMFVETSVVTESVVSDRTLSVRINGTTFKICLKA